MIQTLSALEGAKLCKQWDYGGDSSRGVLGIKYAIGFALWPSDPFDFKIKFDLIQIISV